jgi:hypothetical protein
MAIKKAVNGSTLEFFTINIKNGDFQLELSQRWLFWEKSTILKKFKNY